jgi:hypothetical protein
MPLVAAGVVLIALGVILALFASTTLGIILAIVGAVMMAFGFTTYQRGAVGGGDHVIIRDRPVRRRVVEREREREIL